MTALESSSWLPERKAEHLYSALHDIQTTVKCSESSSSVSVSEMASPVSKVEAVTLMVTAQPGTSIF